MKKILIATAVAAVLAAPQVFAQANNFTGFSVGANVNLATMSTELSEPGSSIKLGESSQNASLQAAYGLALGKSGVLGFGATVGLGDLKAGALAEDGKSVNLTWPSPSRKFGRRGLYTRI